MPQDFDKNLKSAERGNFRSKKPGVSFVCRDNPKRSVEKLKNVNRMTMRRGTNAMGALLKKKKSDVPQDVADSTSGLYHFRKSKFNLAGLSPFLENYLFR